MGAPSERQSLGFFSLLALGINGIVGVGIFFVPSKVGELAPGSAGVLVYALTALALSPVAWVYATLGARYAEDGGPYVWARAAFGSALGFAVGWISFVSALFSTSAVVAGLVDNLVPALGFAGSAARRLSLGLCVTGLAAVAASGLRPSAFVWNGVTVLKLVPLLVLVGLFAVAGSGPEVASATTGGGVELLRAALIVVFALQGFEVVPVPAGHARRTALAIPAATLGSLALAAVLYIALHAACVRALPNLATTPAPLVAAGTVLGGPSVGWLIGVGTNVSALGIAFAMFAMSPRYLAALGRPDAFGAWLGREDSRRVPQWALWLTAGGVLALVQLRKGEELFVLSSVAVLAQYAVSAAALVRLSLKREHGLRAIHLLPAPLALGAILLVGQAARLKELAVASSVLIIGALLLLVRRVASSEASSNRDQSG